jgi:hypothetical protein
MRPTSAIFAATSGVTLVGGKSMTEDSDLSFERAPDLQGIEALQLVKQLGEADELGITGPAHGLTPGFVGDAIDRVNRELHDKSCRIARLQQEQHGGWRNGRHQLLDDVSGA